MKLKYIFQILTVGAFTILSSCNTEEHAHKENEHADHDHKEGADDHGHDHKEDDHEDHDHAKGEKHADHEEHDHNNPDHDHSECGVQIGPKGGRMLTDITGEVLLNEDGTLSVIFTEGTAIEKMVVLLDNKPLTMTKGSEEKYDSTNIKDQLPAKLVASVTIAGKKEVDSFELDPETCEECSNAEYKCVCDNHDH